MTLLLDTHALLWSLTDPDRLPVKTRRLVSDRQHDVLLSTVVLWEIAIKVALGKLPLQRDLASWLPGYVDALGYRLLPINLSHALAVEHVPLHHRDPFDRLLVAQAQLEQATLVSADPVFARYDVPLLWT